MSERIDDQLVRMSRVLESDRYIMEEGAAFCLVSVWNALPESKAGEAARESLLSSVVPNPGGSIQCPIEGCVTTVYPKNPDYKSDEDGELNGVVYNPLDDEYCRFRDFCLKEAFEVGKDIESKGLKSAVVMGSYRYYTAECDLVGGASFPGGNRCVRPGCKLSAGFSEDGVGGTAADCKKAE